MDHKAAQPLLLLLWKNLLSNPESAFYGIVQESKDRAALMVEAGAVVNDTLPIKNEKADEVVQLEDRIRKEAVVSTSF